MNSNLSSDAFLNSSEIFSATDLFVNPTLRHFDQSITFCKFSKFSSSETSAPVFLLSSTTFQAPKLASLRFIATSSPLPGIPSTNIFFTTPVFSSRVEIFLSTASQYLKIRSCNSLDAS